MKVVIGILLMVSAFPMLFWNEGRAVRTAESLSEGRGLAISVSSDKVDAANEGKLVHTNGRAKTSDIVSDPVFGVSANTLALRRKVEMYQWKETSESRGRNADSTVYRYTKDWSEALVDSTKFKAPDEHVNPTAMAYKSDKWIAPTVMLGAYRLSPSQVDRIPGEEPVKPAAPPPGAMVARPVHALGEALIIGENPEQLKIGDLRVTFTKTGENDVSVVARQVGTTFEPYRAKAGSSVDLQSPGIVSADHMFSGAEEANITQLWALRVMGFILMAIGFRLMLKPLSEMTGGIPIIGSIVGTGLTAVAMLLAGVLSLTTISIAWIFYRPLLGLAILVIGGAAIYAIWRYAGKTRTKPAPTTTESA